MTNTDARAVSYKDRLINLETEKRERAEDIRELAKEMKGVGLSATEVAGVKLAVKRYFETADAKAKRITVEEFAESLGSLVGTPLGAAAVHRHAEA